MSQRAEATLAVDDPAEGMSSVGQIDPNNLDWLRKFQVRKGRSLRVLHIGNIANNGFLNARFLNDRCIQADCLVYDYYHIMACPEWEEADFGGEVKDQLFPDWNVVDLRGYCRPRWFVQGPLAEVLALLVARGSGRDGEAWWLEERLSALTRLPPRSIKDLLREPWSRICAILLAHPRLLLWNQGLRRRLLDAKVVIDSLPVRWAAVSRQVLHLGGRAIRKCCAEAPNWLDQRPDFIGRAASQVLAAVILIAVGVGVVLGTCGVLLLAVPAFVVRGILLLVRRLCASLVDFAAPAAPVAPAEQSGFHARIEALREAFRDSFPDRVDQLTREDLIGYASSFDVWRQILAHYDIIHGNGTDPVLPMLCGETPYVAFEHGTIRQIPFDATTQGRLTALSYKLADAVLITNCDNKLAAEKLGLRSYSFVPHPINEALLRRGCGERLRSEVLVKLDADFLVFHPARQHWAQGRPDDGNWAKGNEQFIRALGRYIRSVHARAAAVFVEWGQFVPQSRALLEELGIADRVLWIPPQHAASMARYVDASDVLADQFFLGAFGGILPKGLRLGKPVLCYLDTGMHSWCLPELPPILNVRTEEEIYAALVRLRAEPELKRRLAADGIRWYERYHSAAVVADRLIAAYRRALSGRNLTTR